MADAEAKKDSWLMRAFKKAAEVVTIGLAAAVCWQLFLDPLFFLPIHDVTNTTMQSWVAFINDHFGWIPDLTGATGGSGILNSDFVQNNFLEKYAEQVAVVTPEQNTSFSMEDALRF